MRISVLALQGALIEHEQRLRALGAEVNEIWLLNDWDPTVDGLIIPGGESTTMSKLLVDLKLMQPVREAILGGMPVLGTCAGLILLAKDVPDNADREMIGTMDIRVRRNAYGRQLGSFHTDLEWNGESIPATFIRAPYIESVGEGVKVLSIVDKKIVAAEQDNMLVTAFHPELDDDMTVHKHFLAKIRN